MIDTKQMVAADRVCLHVFVWCSACAIKEAMTLHLDITPVPLVDISLLPGLSKFEDEKRELAKTGIAE